jgi:hypothetical protein
MTKITRKNYKKDKYYNKVTNAVHEILVEQDFVSPVDVFIKLDYLKKEDYEDWRFARIPHLEKVIQCNLSKANRVLRILRIHAEDIGLKESKTVYKKWGKGKNRIILHFSKYRDQNVENSYSTHYIKPKIENSTNSNESIQGSKSATSIMESLIEQD